MDYEKRFKKIQLKVKKILSNSPRCHDWEHTLRVLYNSQKIASMEKKCDIKVIELAALLHDIARASEKKGNLPGCHAKRGALMGREILEKEGFPKEFIDKVVKCIRRHRYRSDDHPQSIEEKIVYDADKLDSLGAIGVGRAFLFAGRIGAKVHNSKWDAINSPTMSENDTAYREYLVKLRYISEKLTTETGREMAVKRTKFMKKFFKRLNKETMYN